MDLSPTLVSSSLLISPILWPADGGGEFYDHDYNTPLESDVDFGGQIQVDADTGIDHVPLPQDALPSESIPPVPPQTDNNNNDKPVDLLTLVPAFQQMPPVCLIYLQSVIAHITGVETGTNATN
ncbi:hypothetical protein BDR07DRAFT_1495160 [Suillus spraguei]|nr:hypothetical protein BDR07DRAFT_1495160 [Suillus spraguei]